MPEVETESQRATGRSLALREVFQAKEAEIHSVTVYRDRAEVKRSVLVRAEEGENEVVVSGLPECTDKNSIRVEGLSEAAKSVIITDVIYSTETKSLQEEEGGEGVGEGEYERLKGMIKEKQKELKHLGFKKTVLTEERKLLETFASHVAKVSNGKSDGGGEQRPSNDLPELLEGGTLGAVLQFMERYQEKLAQIDSRKLEVEGQQKTLTEEVNVLQAKADKINPKKGKTTQDVHSVIISLESGEKCDIHLLVSYVVSCAAWSSSYDIRVFTKDKTMKLQYYGLIKQWTGEDWENASISLSTAHPSIGGSAPNLPTRIVRFWRPPAEPRSLRYSAIRYGLCEELDDESEDLFAMSSLVVGGGKKLKQKRRRSVSPPSGLAVETAQVDTGLFSTTFSIHRKTTIPADKTEHKVTVALIDLTPEFRYVSVPRLSPYSFLQASATNSSPYTLLAGPANIFLDNNFIAKSELNDVSAGEQFTASLGVDQAIRISCQPVAVLHSTARGLSKNQVHTYTHAIKVKNTRQDEVEIEVSEQVPMSQDDRIKVHILEPDVKKMRVVAQLLYGHAILNDAHNLEWHVNLAADTELELKLVYSVEHPPQDRVDGLPKM